ncbi:reverse transcriptase domain-containing protein [Tanacetum coccineum]
MGTTEVTNRAIKRILERLVGYNPKNWSKKLNNALWVFKTAYKTPTGCTPFRLVYGKSCHLPMEIEHKAYWALKQCNMDLTAAPKNRFMELNELMELRDGAYENTWIYKEITKRWYDSRLRRDKNFKVEDKVLLFYSRFKMHPGKLKSRWCGPNVVKTVYPYGTVEITDKNGIRFKVNGQRLKKYHDRHIDAEDKEVVEFKEDTTMSYPSRKIRHICACTSLKTTKEQDPIRAASGLRPHHFTYPERRLTMEEMLYKFIDEGKREHEEMRIFIWDDEVIFDVDQSIKKPPAKDDECYRIDELDDTINTEAQEVLTNDRKKSNNESDLGIPIRRINSVNMLYSVKQRTARSDEVKSEHLYSASANEIDEKTPELKSFPNHLEYAYM